MSIFRKPLVLDNGSLLCPNKKCNGNKQKNSTLRLNYVHTEWYNGDKNLHADVSYDGAKVTFENNTGPPRQRDFVDLLYACTVCSQNFVQRFLSEDGGTNSWWEINHGFPKEK